MTLSIKPDEIAHFSKDSSHWWDEEGPFKPLHKLNPIRIEYIQEQIYRHLARQSVTANMDGQNKSGDTTFKNLKIIDIGCGGGLVCEPFARLGACVTGVDADENAIEVAKDHAAIQDLAITYKAGASEHINEQFDVVLALEIIEHVPEPSAFVEECVRLCKPDGLVVFSTLNRTLKSYALGIIAAEYIMNWVPKGTHHWKQFIKPSELSGFARNAGLDLLDISGLVYQPLQDSFSMQRDDVDVNYFLVAHKKA